jgi:hypothetical protein
MPLIKDSNMLVVKTEEKKRVLEYIALQEALRKSLCTPEIPKGERDRLIAEHIAYLGLFRK